MKRIIVNADDFGLDAQTVDWTIRGFECGALTSATIMAGMPAMDEACRWAKQHPEFSFGVHLCLVDERPMSEPKAIPSLVDPKTGRLWATRQFILRNFAGVVRVEDLVTEMCTQYSAISATGLPISHVDGHGHNHRLPQSIRALREMARIMGLSDLKVRRCQDIAVGREGLLGRLINKPMQRRLAGCGFRMTDHFAMNAGHSTDPHWYSHLLATLPDGTTEIGIHPGDDEPWRKIDTEEAFSLGRDVGVARITFNDI